MKTSETFTSIAEAIAKFRSKPDNLDPDKQGAALRRNHLLVMQDTKGDGRTVGAMTRLVHTTSGEWIETEWLSLPAGRSTSDSIAALHRAQHNSLLAALGVARADVLSAPEPPTPGPVEPVAPSAGSTSRPFHMPAWKVRKVEKLARETAQSEDDMAALLSAFGGAPRVAAMTREDSDRLITHLEQLKGAMKS